MSKYPGHDTQNKTTTTKTKNQTNKKAIEQYATWRVRWLDIDSEFCCPVRPLQSHLSEY